MYSDVVQPLLDEARKSNEANKRLKKVNAQLKHDLKLLNACIRLPAMCDQFQKACRRKMPKEM